MSHFVQFAPSSFGYLQKLLVQEGTPQEDLFFWHRNVDKRMGDQMRV